MAARSFSVIKAGRTAYTDRMFARDFAILNNRLRRGGLARHDDLMVSDLEWGSADDELARTTGDEEEAAREPDKDVRPSKKRRMKGKATSSFDSQGALVLLCLAGPLLLTWPAQPPSAPGRPRTSSRCTQAAAQAVRQQSSRPRSSSPASRARRPMASPLPRDPGPSPRAHLSATKVRSC
jgi:hypothetical protein